MRTPLTILVALLIVSAGIGIYIILVGGFTDTEVRILVTSGVLNVYTVLMMPSLFHARGSRYSYLTRFATASTSITLVMILLLIWGSESTGGTISFLKSLISFAVLAVASNHCLVLLIARPRKLVVRISQKTTIVIIALVATFLVLAIWNEGITGPLLRAFLALAVLGALGSVATPILFKATESDS